MTTPLCEACSGTGRAPYFELARHLGGEMDFVEREGECGAPGYVDGQIEADPGDEIEAACARMEDR